MTLDFIYDSGSSLIVTTGILIFIFLLILGGIAGFLITLKRERAYSKAALPALFSPESDVVENNEQDSQYLAESAFAADEELSAMEDESANALMADISKAKLVDEKSIASSASKAESLSKLTNVFKKKD